MLKKFNETQAEQISSNILTLLRNRIKVKILKVGSHRQGWKDGSGGKAFAVPAWTPEFVFPSTHMKAKYGSMCQ